MPRVSVGIYLKSVLSYKFLILDTYHTDVYIYVRKDDRIRGYFSKPKRIGELKALWNTALTFKNRASYI